MIGRLRALPIVLVTLWSVNQQILAEQCLKCDNTVDLPLDCRFDIEERTYLVRGCRASIGAEWNGWEAVEQTDFCLATPPQGTILINHMEHPISNNNGSFSVSKYTKGLDFSYEKSVKDAFETAIELAKKNNDKQLEDHLKSEYKKTLDIIERAKTNMDTVRVEVKARPHGSVFDRKRGWMDVRTDLYVKCVAPINLKEQLLQKYKLDNVAKSAPRKVTFYNNSGRKMYVHARMGDRGLLCKSGQRATQNFEIRSQEKIDVQMDIDQNVCHTYSEDVPKVSNPSLCIDSLGSIITLDRSQECYQKP